MKAQELRKTFFAIATIVLLGAIQPGIGSAQTSGVGSDGITRLMPEGNRRLLLLMETGSKHEFVVL